ncbi:hypothetical protein LJB98_03405 [Bacteroidales bacterium OttesenSCG-928-M11]|jgi:hypothetical protein|nr:hypothetical protein [Bacteroidales bacterium OttesenSCG-928-M11]
MKKTIILFVLSIISFGAFAQKNQTEILYFKAQLPCCQATACNNLESVIKAIVEKNFPNGDVVFKQVALADTDNKELIEKYSAKSQTVVIVNTKKKNKTSTDVSAIVRAYARSNDKDTFEKELVEKINTAKK